MLVSPDDEQRRAIGGLLGRHGLTVQLAADLHAGLALAGASPWALLLLDLRARLVPMEVLRARLGDGALVLLGSPGGEDGPLLALAAACLPWPPEPGPLLVACERGLERAALLRECRRLSEQVRQGEEEWGRTLDTLPDAVLICDAQGRIVRANRALQDLVGVRQPEGRTLDVVLAPLRLRRRAEEAIAGGGTITFDESPPGLGRTFTVTISPLRDEGQGACGTVVLLRDVTDERRLQRRLLLGERMAAVGQLAAGLAHEINNPVSFVLSNLQIARELLEEHRHEFGAPLAELHEMLGDCLVGVERVRDIVRDLKTFTSTEVRTADGEVRLDDLIDLALRLMRTEVEGRARLVYERDLSPTPPLRGDAGKLSHVLLNLLAQAVQNLPSAEDSGRVGHSITVRTRVDRRQGVVELTVADTGPTLSEELRAHLFEPFAQRRLRLPPELSARIGMGLAVSYEVVRRHGGEIEARAAKGGGNELLVRLPLPPSREQAPSPPRRRVLFVDDEPLLLRSYQRLIGDLHDVTTASSGHEALALLQAGESFDTIFCDLVMPSMDGRQLYRTVADRDVLCAQRFVFLTGGATSPDVLEFLQQVDNPHVDKPVGRESLVRAIEQLHTGR